MPGAIRNTVDRLDKPSAYYQAKVIVTSPFGPYTIAGTDQACHIRTRSASTIGMTRSLDVKGHQNQSQKTL